MTQSLRERLIGAWELIDLVEEPVDGSPARYPMGEDPVGLILYAPDGFMSVQIMQAGHAAAGSEDPYGRTAGGLRRRGQDVLRLRRSYTRSTRSAAC